MNTLTQATTSNTSSTNTQGNTMTTSITFEQAVFNRLGTCKTWNPIRLNQVVRDMWVKDQSLVKGETTGDFMKKFFENFRGDLKARKFSFFDTSIVVGIYNRTWESHNTVKEDYIKDVIEVKASSHTVNVYTDGSCNVGAKTGGWGVHMTVEGYPKFDKDFSGNQEKTTNNAMELLAMIEAIKAIDFTKKNFNFNLITDSKYVLQSICNQGKYGREGYKSSANVELLKLLYAAMSEKRIKFDDFTRPVMGNKSINSGDVVHSAHTPNGNQVNFVWVKGHSDNGGNDKADKLATQARKQLDKAAKEPVDVVVPEVVSEVSTVSVVSSSVDFEKVIPSDLEAVIEYNKINSTHDFTYMFSDDHRKYQAGHKTDKVLAAIEKTLSPIQLDLVALYNNYVLERNCEQFRKSVSVLIDCVESSYKYFRESVVVFNESRDKFVVTDLEYIGDKFASDIVNSIEEATVLTPFHAEILTYSLNNYGGDTFVTKFVLV